MRWRRIEDRLPPFCLNTSVGCTVAEERFVAMVQSYAQEPLGAHPNDGLAVAAMAEMKVDHERLKKVVFLDHKGNRYGLCRPIMGGYAGGPEATALVYVAHHFLGLLAFGAQWHDGFPLHVMQGRSTTRELLWLVAVTGQALTRNTGLLIGVSPFTASDSCTEMVVLEIAASVLAATVSGLHPNLVAVARTKLSERSSGMEARIGAETAHLVAREGITR